MLDACWNEVVIMLREGFITPDNVQKKTYFSNILRNLKYELSSKFNDKIRVLSWYYTGLILGL